MVNEKEFVVNVELKFSNYISAESKEQAIKQVKNSFLEEYGIKLVDKEISVEE